MKTFILCFAAAAMFFSSLHFSVVSVFAVVTAVDETKEKVRYTDPKETIKVSPGASFDIVLASNPTTGYSWGPAKVSDDKVVKFVSSKFIAKKSRLAGSGGKEVWTFSALAPGKTTILLQYKRPWEKDKVPIEEVTFTVIVAP